MGWLTRFFGLEGATKPGLRLARTIVLLGPAFAAAFQISTTFWMISIATNLGGGDYIAGLTAVGFLVVVQLLIQVVLDYPSGAVGDWIGQRWIIASAMLCYGAAYWLTSLASPDSPFVLFLAIYVLMGVGSAQESGAFPAWFDNNYAKIVSVSASLATSSFIRHYHFDKEIPCGFGFDSRAFIMPTRDEVANYFVWRQNDAVRNSIQMATRAEFSHRECMYQNNEKLQEMLFQRGINWNDYTVRCKRGGFVSYQRAHERDPHSSWIFLEPPTFSKDREFLLARIPNPLQDEE